MTETVYAALINGSECDGLKWFCMQCLSCIQTLVQNVNATVNPTCTTGTQTDTSTVYTSSIVTQNLLEHLPENNDVEAVGPSDVKKNESNTGSYARTNVQTYHNKVREDHPRSTPICRCYRIGKCNKGENCNFRHPEKRIKYCRNGRDSCDGGFRECQLLHLVLRRNSLRNRECFDMDCTLAILKGLLGSL